MLMKRIPLQDRQEGFAALVVAITLVIILSLLTVSFAQLMRNELNQSTNRQLSEQAYYAAESGVNDAERAILADPTHTVTKTGCGPYASPNPLIPSQKYLTDNNVDAGSPTATHSVQWTCLLINPYPGSLEYSPVGTSTPTVFSAQAVSQGGSGPVDVSSLTVHWTDADNSATPYFRNVSGYGSNTAFPPITSWKDGSGNPSIGAVRLQISVAPATFSTTSLADGTVTAYLYPSTDTSNQSLTFNYGAANNQTSQGTILNGGCNTSNQPLACSSTIYFSPAVPVNSWLVFSLRSLYGDTHVYITANTSLGSTVYFKGAQTVVDSTGRAQNVLKRIEARVPDQPKYDFPGFPLDSAGDICKQLSTYPGQATSLCDINAYGY